VAIAILLVVPLCFVLISRIVNDIDIHKDSPVDPAMTLVLLYCILSLLNIQAQSMKMISKKV
jgi:hypothetical protein